MAMMIAGCENSDSAFDEFGNAVSIAEDEVFALKSAESTESDINAARFGGHMFGGGMMIKGPHYFFGRHFPHCASVTVNGEDYPKEIIIDYGEGCVGRAGLEKKGIITVQISDTITEPGATYTVTFKDVTIGHRQVNRTATVTNEGQNGDGNWVISLQSETTVNYGDTLIVTRVFEGGKEWLSGFETPEVDDDQFYRTGGGTITVNDELVFERTITDAIFFDRACMFPLSGIIEITKDGELMVIDFGDGACDNIAVVSKERETEEIELLSGRFRKGFNKRNRHMRLRGGWW